MRQWAYLKQPYDTNKKNMVYKIMVHETKKIHLCIYIVPEML